MAGDHVFALRLAVAGHRNGFDLIFLAFFVKLRAWQQGVGKNIEVGENLQQFIESLKVRDAIDVTIFDEMKALETQLKESLFRYH